MIHRSSHPQFDVPEASLADYVLSDAPARGDRSAVVDGMTGEAITFTELEEGSARAAAGLLRAGLQPGDVVALISHNQPSYAIAVHAVLRAGGVVTPINPVLTVAEINGQLVDSGARVVISASALGAKVDEAATGTAAHLRFHLDAHRGGTDAFSALAASERATLPHIDPASAAVLPYSSGTTGRSKGVVLTHRNLVANLEQLRGRWRLDDSDVLCAALPLFHVYGFTVILNSALLAGATLITLPRFDLTSFLRVVQEHQVTRGHIAPPIALRLAHAPEVDDYDLSSMRIAVCGAAPLDGLTARRVTERTGIRLVQGYGMTEASPGILLVADDDVGVPPSSVGKLLPGTDARLVDPRTGQDVEPGAPGELWIRGPQVMAGYLNRADATAETVTDGWLHTGDVVEVRDDDFYVVDRLKELIKCSGFQVPPAELEAVLLSHPKVRDVAVVGVSHPTAGEAPKAFVVAEPGVNADELIAWTTARVAPYKKVRDVEFVGEIPKSPTGKILRRILRDEAATNVQPPVSADRDQEKR